MPSFYDCHFHVQNLTHPNLEAFLDRIVNDQPFLKLLDKPLAADFLLTAAGAKLTTESLFRLVDKLFKKALGKNIPPSKAHQHAINLLFLMNRPVDEYLKVVHEDVERIMIRPQSFVLQGQHFDKVYLSALIMDYTDRDYSSQYSKVVAYEQTKKPVVRQTEDLLAGMRRYNEGLKPDQPARLVVLPFLGMNPENYAYEEKVKYEILPVGLLERNNLPDDFFATPGKEAAFQYFPGTGRFEWHRDELTDQDIQDIANAFDPDSSVDIKHKATDLLKSLQTEVRGTFKRTIRLYVNLNANKLTSVRHKFKWAQDSNREGGELTWLDESMTLSERDLLLEAISTRHGMDHKEFSSQTYSVGRIEFLFAQLANQGERETLQSLLEKYFDGPPKKADIEANQKAWTGSIDEVKPGIFAGIKLYPPLGFDPYPEGTIHENSRKKRVWFLYKFCEDNEIPVTVHTSSGGFRILDKGLHELYTSPRRWRHVMTAFPNLKINFAHCGVQDDNMAGKFDWKKELFEEIICKRKNDGSWAYPNAYSDLSDLLNTKEDYFAWERGMSMLDLDNEQWEHLKNRLLFGSDFMINLLHSESYSDYLLQFTDNKNSVFPSNVNGRLRFSDENLRYKMAVTNPERFLFGATV